MILMPTGVRMPVASMSMRVLIGYTQAFDTPGSRTRWSSSARSRSGVIPGRHWSRGFSLITVSNISIGAGSVAVSARPALPNTRSTSGTVMISLSVCCSSARAASGDSPGSVVGMYRRSPSSSSGMNSVPSREAGHSVAITTTVAAIVTAQGRRSASSRNGRYAAIAARLTGFAASGRMRPRTSHQISTGTSVIDSTEAATIA